MRRRAGITALIVALSAPAHAVETGKRRIITTSDIEILEPVTFVRDTVEVTKASERTLDTVAETLRVHDSIKRLAVRVEGEDGELAERRSSWLVEELVRRGVDRARLTPATEAGAKPVVSFLIVERSGD